MANIALTDADFNDLLAGHSINAMADDGSEHDLYGSEFAPAEFDALETGAELFVTINGVECRVSYPD